MVATRGTARSATSLSVKAEADGTTLELGAVERLDHVLGVLAAGEFNDASALGLTLLVLEEDDLDRSDLVLSEKLPQVIFADVPVNVAHENFVVGAWCATRGSTT